MSSDLVHETSSSKVQLLGRVKWFNNKAGYGFITVTDGSQSGNDIFVHHSGIDVSREQYRYLVQGEYVQFSLDNTSEGIHSVQAKSVCGINNGMLMCETRRDVKQSRFSYKSDEETPAPRDQLTPSERPRPRSMRAPRDNALPSRERVRETPNSRGSGPRGDKEWSLVKK